MPCFASRPLLITAYGDDAIFGQAYVALDKDIACQAIQQPNGGISYNKLRHFYSSWQLGIVIGISYNKLRHFYSSWQLGIVIVCITRTVRYWRDSRTSAKNERTYGINPPQPMIIITPTAVGIYADP
jgi:hypothetical protein